MAKPQFNVIDSSAWLAYFADEPSARSFAAAIEDVRSLVVPAICLGEVFKVVTRQRGEGDALQAVALMQQGLVEALDAELALTSAQLGIELKLPLADSIVYATARRYDAVVWTLDADFEGLPGIKYFRKR
jgi:predicted nucleic acid-binding protein